MRDSISGLKLRGNAHIRPAAGCNLPETLKDGDVTLTIQILYSDTEYKALRISDTFPESRGEV